MHEIVEAAEPGDRLSLVFDVFIILLIVVTVITLSLETVESIQKRHAKLFHWIEVFSLAAFTIEYVLRVWSCTANPAYSEPFRGRVRFIRSPLLIIDLLAILPLFVTMWMGQGYDARFIRVLRLFRLLRLTKLARYSRSIRMLGRVYSRKKSDLVIVLVGQMVALLLVSNLIWIVEHEKSDSFTSIPAAMWWSVTTLTTVGYGDIVPVTVLGKVLATVVSLLGVALFAMPAAILASGFIEELGQQTGPQAICPHCHERLDAPPMYRPSDEPGRE